MSLTDKLIKRFNSEDVIKFSDKNGFEEIESWCHSGSPELDYNLGTFGFPTGITEIAGPSKSGKTTLGLLGMKDFIEKNKNGVVAILSSENRDNLDYARKLGIDANKVIIIKIRYVEKMFMQVKSLIETSIEIMEENNVKEKPNFYFLWDSLGATLSKAELETMEENLKNMEKGMEKGKEDVKMKHEKIGAFAKPAKMFAKFLIGEMYDKNIHFIMLNHVYDKISGRGKKSTGGEWVELFSTIRLRTTVRGHEVLDDTKVAQYTNVQIEKNDFGSRRETTIEILLGDGLVLSDEDIEFGIETGLIKKEGAKKRTALSGKLSWNSKRTFYQLYWNKNKFLKILHNKILKERRKQVEEERKNND